MLYWLLKPFGLLVLWIFFKKIEVQGRENIPKKGPVIFAGNHPNMLLDALLLAAYGKRKIHYLAKSTLFRNPFLAFFLRSLGVIPVYRRQDEPSRTREKKNQETFEECYLLLERGGAIGIFPEGTSHSEPRLLTLKTGAARIALGAEARNQFQLGVKIVPVGLNFKHRDRFRSSVLLCYGEPILVKEFQKLYEENPREGVQKLTECLERRLSQLILNIQNKEEAEFIQKIERIYRKEFLRKQGVEEEKNRLMTNLVFNQALVDAYDFFHRYAPQKVERLKGEIESYLLLVEQCGTEPEIVGLRLRRQVLFYVLKRLFLLFLGFPLFLYGAFWHYCPYRIPGLLADWWTPHLEEKATIKLLTGLVTFPLFYLIETLLVAFYFSLSLALIFFLTLPLSGLFALWYLDLARPFLRGVKAYLWYLLHWDLREVLEQKKKVILKELHELSEEYLTLKGKAVRG